MYVCVCGVEFFTDPELPFKLDKLMDEREQLLRMNDIIKQLWPCNAAVCLIRVYDTACTCAMFAD